MSDDDNLFGDYEDVHKVDENDEKYFEEIEPIYEEPEYKEVREYRGLEEDEDINEKKNKLGESFINPGPEWRVFANTPGSFDSIRTGKALSGNRMLSTVIGEGGKDNRLQRIQELINKTSRTDEEIFNDSLVQFSQRLNINSAMRDSLIENIVPYIKKIKYKNALTTLLAYICIKNGKIDAEKMEKTLKAVVKETPIKIRLPDMYRYAFMILDVIKSLN
jgi:hypothetical protein